MAYHLIFSALHGKVTEGATTKNIKVETGMNANFKTLTLQLPSPVKISSAKQTTISLQADVAKLIDGVDLITTPIIGAAQAEAMQAVASNYETRAFTLKSGK
ncbi:hypothetical protein [Chitinophaga cymbidii]|uniref:Uncharacterized protein n=1 Tax=Chitinophaga cymbidii TaxID=1096750 RepID=A0A512RS41_9BACT|nr:hypothetical protein [Chitinophaga cymbidii]GEP98504.1 hypothetical protein CCY01nite_47640 [Chitinophaga cymbidii]